MLPSHILSMISSNLQESLTHSKIKINFTLFFLSIHALINQSAINITQYLFIQRVYDVICKHLCVYTSSESILSFDQKLRICKNKPVKMIQSFVLLHFYAASVLLCYRPLSILVRQNHQIWLMIVGFLNQTMGFQLSCWYYSLIVRRSYLLCSFKMSKLFAFGGFSSDNSKPKYIFLLSA